MGEPRDARTTLAYKPLVLAAAAAVEDPLPVGLNADAADADAADALVADLADALVADLADAAADLAALADAAADLADAAAVVLRVYGDVQLQY
jgi:hypothetical protein